jgi:hypothetical protein
MSIKAESLLLGALVMIAGGASFWFIGKFGNCRDLGVTVAQCLSNQ